MKIAIAILATNEYWKGAQTLFHTLRKYGSLDNSVDCFAMGADRCAGATCVPITKKYSNIKVNDVYFKHVASKFFALTFEYDRIILMDADMLCVGNASYLWSPHIGTLPFYACRDTASVVYYHREIACIGLNPRLLFNAGTMVFHPKMLTNWVQSVGGLYPTFYAHLMYEMEFGKLKAYDGGDQGYLNHYFQGNDIEIGYLPPEYNECTDKYMPVVTPHAKAIIHFTGPNANPWAPRVPRNDPRVRLFKQWKEEFHASKASVPAHT